MARHGRAFPFNRVYKRPTLAVAAAGAGRSFGYIFCWVILFAAAYHTASLPPSV